MRPCASFKAKALWCRRQIAVPGCARSMWISCPTSSICGSPLNPMLARRATERIKPDNVAALNAVQGNFEACIAGAGFCRCPGREPGVPSNHQRRRQQSRSVRAAGPPLEPYRRVMVVVRLRRGACRRGDLGPSSDDPRLRRARCRGRRLPCHGARSQGQAGADRADAAQARRCFHDGRLSRGEPRR